MKVEIVKRPELRLATVRHVGSYMRITEAFQRLNDLVTAAGLSKPDTLLVGIYHDDPSVTPEDKLRSDAGITIPPRTKLPPGLKELVIPSGRYAHTTHTGPYSGLRQVWNQLRSEWVPRNGETIGSGLSYEVYRNTPMNAKPDELVTDVYLPLV
ncbi:MAG TPA: GyrI-like domain-containing protein [Gemmatimonadaceae bacterium]|nr:GyrI-like domain-containing protein [Gemmatimonadaceae bacterium]